MILILPASTTRDSFGHRGRLASDIACERNSDWTGALSWPLPNCRFHGEAPGNHSNSCCLLSLRAVTVHAPIRRLPAGLTGHPVPHLHGQPCLSAPLDGASQLLAPCFCGDKREAPIAPCHRSRPALRAAHHRSSWQKHSEPEITDMYQIFHFKITIFLILGKQHHKSLLLDLGSVAACFPRQTTAYAKHKSAHGGNQIYITRNPVCLKCFLWMNTSLLGIQLKCYHYVKTCYVWGMF